MAIFGLVTLVVLVALYFLPVIVANSRTHSQLTAIAVLNLLLGWTIIGWVAAMVWAVTKERASEADILAKPLPLPRPAPSLTGELERLARLRHAGVISEDEFLAAKRKALR